MLRLLVSLLLAFIPLITPIQQVAFPVQAAPQDVTYMRDYTHGDCSADDSPGFQQAVTHWASTGGILNLQTGCYSLNESVIASLPNDNPIFGIVEGDGPDQAQIHCGPGVGRCLQFNQFWYGHLQGFSLTGAGYGTQDAGSNTDYGLVLSNGVQDLGSQAGSIEDVRSGGFARCFMLGDDSYPSPSGPGAAAEFTLTNIGGDYCGSGEWLGGNNTGDFINIKPGFTHSGSAFFTGYGAPFQVVIKGGGATNNDHELSIQGDCAQFTMEDYRSEGNNGIPILAGGCSGQKLFLSSLHLNAQVGFAPYSIQLDNGDTQLTVFNSELNGPIEHVQGLSTVNLTGNTIASPDGVSFVVFSDPNCCGAIHLYSQGNRNTTSPNGMYPGAALPDYADGIWLTPPGQGTPVPTNTPLPQPTATNTPVAQPTPTNTPVPPTPTATPIPPTATPTNTPLPTATPVPPTPTPVPTQWVSPAFLSTFAARGGCTDCVLSTSSFYGFFDTDVTWQAHLTNPNTFEAYQWVGNGGTTGNVTFTFSGSNDGITWTTLTTDNFNLTGNWQTWGPFNFSQVTYQYIQLRMQTPNGVNIGSLQLLEP
jgi:hypothetical protein